MCQWMRYEFMISKTLSSNRLRLWIERNESSRGNGIILLRFDGIRSAGPSLLGSVRTKCGANTLTCLLELILIVFCCS